LPFAIAPGEHKTKILRNKGQLLAAFPVAVKLTLACLAADDAHAACKHTVVSSSGTKEEVHFECTKGQGGRALARAGLQPRSYLLT
jgi:hypothetical protein